MSNEAVVESYIPELQDKKESKALEKQEHVVEDDQDKLSVMTTPEGGNEPPDGGRGWLVLAGCFAGLFCTQGYNYTWGVYLEYYNEHVFPGEMTTLSWIGSLWLAMAVILGPIYGFVAYKVGYRWLLITAVFCNTFAMMMASISTQIWQLMLTQGLLAGFGASLVWFPCISAPQQYFSKRRGMAVGIAISGSGFGGLCMSNIATAVNDTLGVGWSLRVVGFINLALISFAACVVKPLNPPLPVKLSQSLSFKPFRNKQFCILFCMQLVSNFAFNVPSGYLPSYAKSLDLDRWIGTNLSAISAGLMIVGKIGTGTVSDYVGRFNTTFVVTTMVGIVIMAVWYTATTAASVWAFAALFGIMGGGFLAILPAVLPQCVGFAQIEQSNGWLFFAWFFGGIAGQPICAYIIEKNGGAYQGAIIFAGVLFLFNGVLAAILRFMHSGPKLFIRI